MNRKQALVYIMLAGYENDTARGIRLYIENRVSREAYNKAFAAGRAKKERLTSRSVSIKEGRKMTLKELHRNTAWAGVCESCGHDYFHDCHGNCTCLSCNAQRQSDEKEAAKMGAQITE